MRTNLTNRIDFMDYGELRKDRDADFNVRNAAIERIYKLFDIESSDIAKASQAAKIPYPSDLWSYYFIALSIGSAKDILGDSDPDDLFDVDSEIDEAADTNVPYQTYVIWSIWIDLDYKVDAYEEINNSIEVNNMEKVAQYQLYKISEDIIRDIVYGENYNRGY